MIYNPEQDPGNRRIEIGPVGDRIAVLRHASLVARQFEDLNSTEESPRSRPTTAVANATVHGVKATSANRPAARKPADAWVSASGNKLDEARSQVAAVLENVGQDAA